MKWSKPMAKNEQLILSFINSEGQEIHINIRSPAPYLTTDTIRKAMDHVIEIGAFCGDSKVIAVKRKKAYFIRKEQEKIQL